jgi:pilus assembly protein CpaB
MAQRRYTIVFYAAVFIAAMATWGVYRVLKAAKTSARIATRSVVVAAKDIPAGAALEKHSLEVKPWPAIAVPKEALSTLESAVGRVARVPVFAGEAIVSGRLARAGTAPGLEARITPGMRAMSVRINDVASLSGLIQPDSRVDVLVSVREGGRQQATEEVSKLFLENMRVLSMGSRTMRDQSGEATPATTATLEVTPVQAEKLAVAMRHGVIQLVLRGFDDDDSTGTTGSTSSEVMAQLREAKPQAVVAQVEKRPPRSPSKAPAERVVPPPVAVAPAVVRPDSLTVRVYRGNTVTQQKFDTTHANGSTNGNGTTNGHSP